MQAARIWSVRVAIGMLNTDTATPYLVARGLVSPKAIVDGDLTIVSAARRNRNLRVEGPAGVGYLIKQPDNTAQDSCRTVQCEAAFYAFCQQQPMATPMARILPRLVYFDAEEYVLILDLLQNALPLWQFYNSHGADNFPFGISRELGRTLGVLHKTFRLQTSLRDPHLPWSHSSVPWILSVHKPGPDMLAILSPANYQTLRILQTQDGLCKQIDGVRRLWTPDTIIHNDIKGDNILVLPTTTESVGDAEIRMVDWEMVQIGDAAWDFAGALHDFVLVWMASLPVALEVTVDEAISRAHYPWGTVQTAIRALWQGYRRWAELTDLEADAFLLRAVRFSAARLIQAAYEMSHHADRLTTQAVLLLQISANLLDEPEQAQSHFYGIPSALAFRA